MTSDSYGRIRRVNLFVIGVNKAGSSWLYYLLAAHPAVFMSEVKELYYFGHTYPEEKEKYHSHFNFDETHTYYGEATPTYYRDENIARQIRRYNPDAKLLAIVRDPIQRLLSQFYFHKQLGLVEESDSLEDALYYRDSRLLADSHYEQTLPCFTRVFGESQFRVFSLEHARARPEEFWWQLLEYLELPMTERPEAQDRSENATGSSLFRWVYRHTIRPVKVRYPTLYEALLRSSFIRWSKRQLLNLLGRASKEELEPALKARLRQEFAATYAYMVDLGLSEYYPTVETQTNRR